MAEPEKPFACSIQDCGMTFTNGDHLDVHTKKHDMILQLGDQKAVFVADQTPTPTRFIKNCEEVGLFQDLQNVNPFDEGFKRAMDTRTGVYLTSAVSTNTDDVLHTPQMIYPSTETDSSFYKATNNQNITISRSSSDENGTKEFETTTISKLTNEVTTISRIIERDLSKQDVGKPVFSNVITIAGNIQIQGDGTVKHIDANNIVGARTGPLTKLTEASNNKEINNKTRINGKRKHILCLEALEDSKKGHTGIKYWSDLPSKRNGKPPKLRPKPQENVILKEECIIKEEDVNQCEVIIKFPNKSVKLRPVLPKQQIKESIEKRVSASVIPETNQVPNILYPVNLKQALNEEKIIKIHSGTKEKNKNNDQQEEQEFKKAAQCARSKRYRDRLKLSMNLMKQECDVLDEKNKKLMYENQILKKVILEHINKCQHSDDLKNQLGTQMKINK